MMKVNYVNVELGTASTYRESNGNTLPNVQYPLGNQSYILSTDNENGGWFYNPNVAYTEGIRISNQPSPWLGDYGQIVLMPISGKYYQDVHSSITQKKLSPYEISCFLNRYQTQIDLTPTAKGAELKVENQSNQQSKLVIDCFAGENSFEIVGNKLFLTIVNINESEYAEHFRKYYVLEFSENIMIEQILADNQVVTKTTNQQMKLVLTIDASVYNVTITSSYISYEQLRLNLEREQTLSYNQKKEQTKNEWEKLLNTIEITDNQICKKTFYSNLYRVFCYPRFISEITKENEEVYYDFSTKTIRSGTMISDVGFWDTYRTTMPLMRMLTPKIYQRIIKALLNHYQATKFLPRWLSPYERGIMPSTLTDVVIAEAFLTDNISKEDEKIAIEALLKNGDYQSENALFGRKNLQEYIKYGYVPADSTNESVSMSLDNYLSDYAISKVLKKINHQEASRYQMRCQNYQLMFNQENKFFAPKNKDGKFTEQFNPDLWGNDFCESSAWQNNFNLVFDPEGLVKLFGGKDECLKRLDQIFENKAQYQIGKYHQEIHEMTEMIKCENLGYFAISNQPSFILPFWYLVLGAEKQFDAIIEKTLQYFTSEKDGYPGDEDNGSLAAWYIWVMIGKYPFNPLEKQLSFKSQCKYKINQIKE